MLQVHPDASLVPLLRRIVAADDIFVKLFTGAITVDFATVLADITELALGDGYAPISVPVAGWLLESTVDHKGLFMRAPVIWTATATTGIVVNGYYMVDATETILLSATLFDTPFAWNDTVVTTVWPRFGDESLYGH